VIRRLPTAPPAPCVWLLDARPAGLDPSALRDWARELPAPPGARRSSRSYRHPFALVAFSAGPVGVDLERVEPPEPRFAASICTPQERGLGLEHDAAAVACLWSGKEALAKALGDARAYDPRRLGSPLLWPEGRAGPWRALRLQAPAGHVAWVCWREPEAGAAD